MKIIAVIPKKAATKSIFLSIFLNLRPKIGKVFMLKYDINQEFIFINITFCYLRVIFLDLKK